MEDSKQLIRQILLDGLPEEKRLVFSFTIEDDDLIILKKFKLFSRTNYTRFFESIDAPFHDEMLLNFIRAYKGGGNAEANLTEIAFRGAAKTSMLKLFLTFALLCDTGGYRKYIKILSKDGKNSKQIVTDIYNLIVEVVDIFGNIFDRGDNRKREETMSSFTTETGRKLSSGTVGQTQRGHIQDAYRPDLLWFEDIEDRDSVASVTITEGIIKKADEAIQGLAIEGNYILTANYISDTGSVQWFLNRPKTTSHIVPIIDEKGKPVWNRYTPQKIADLKAGTDDWAGEYLCDPTRVGDKFFDVDRVNGDIANASEPIKESAGIRYWADFMPHHRYGIGEDLSDGVGADSCALALFDFTTGDLVASADDNEMAPDLFTYEVARVGREFGNCIIAPEINNTCGGIAISTLKDTQYPQIYVKEVFDKVGNFLSTQLGWESNRKTKPMMYYEFRKDYNDGLIKIHDIRVLKEMKAYTKADLSDARSASSVTRHFDLLTAVVISWQMKDVAKIAGDVKKFYANLANRERKPRGAVR
jgi:hypothetical protein